MKRLRRWWWLSLMPLCVFAFSSPQDVTLPAVSERTAPGPALFSHWRHQASQQCFNCHPSIFEQQRKGFTHEQMKAGQFCGACHDGSTTKAMSTMKCEACHVAR